MRIVAEEPDSVDARMLVAELSAALERITGDTGTSSFDTADVRSPRALFLIARDAAGLPIACGALRPLDESTAEIKRMYARAGSRAGAALLAELERRAAAFGYQRTCLSTRRINERAVSFYQRHGYTEIAPYGHYAERAQSICMGKQLSRRLLPAA
jgi:GNAT superfamily N-acetyltransferase